MLKLGFIRYGATLMQEPTSTKIVIAEAYYKKALELESQYKAMLPNLTDAKAKYERSCEDEDKANAYGYFGEGRKAPNPENYEAVKNNVSRIYTDFINALQNAAAHGSVDAGLLLINYGQAIKSESQTIFGLEDRNKIADALYEASKKLKSKYLEDKLKFETEWQKYQADCTKASEESNYGYFGDGRTRPNEEPSNCAEKLMESSKAKYIAKLREAAKYGSQEAIKELIDRKLPLKAPESPECLVM